MKSIYLKLLVLIMIAISCSEDDNINITNNEHEKYAGKYNIISFRSDIPVDLNNDGVTSYELTSEINSLGFSDLEIRANRNNSEDFENLLSFFFPKTWISFQTYNSKPYTQFIDYGFITYYSFKENTFKLKKTKYLEEAYIDNVESNKVVKLGNPIKVIDSNHLGFSLFKKFYDFKRGDWVDLNIEIIYEKIDLENL